MDEHRSAQLPTSLGNSANSSANVSDTTAILSRLLSSFPERDSDDDSKIDRIRCYLIALEGYSLDELEEVERQILKAKVLGFDLRFMPTPPQMAKLCNDIRAFRYREAHPPTLPQEQVYEPPNPRMIERFERLSKELGKGF